MTSMRDRLLAGENYLVDDELRGWLLRTAAQVAAFNRWDPLDLEGQAKILRDVLGSLGDGAFVRQPFYCDYGSHTSIGPRTFVNFGVTALDVAPITIGADGQIGPGVQLLTAVHPIEPEARREGWQSGRPITIGDNVWIGGGAIICPGVTIGDDAIIGAGSVVTRDVPAGTIAVGNPARVTRSIHDA